MKIYRSKDKQKTTLLFSKKITLKKPLKSSGLEMEKSRNTPTESNIKYALCPDNITMREAFEIRYSLLEIYYISQHTRPNITYGVTYLSRFQNNPNKEHYAKVKRIIRYLGGTLNYGLLFIKAKIYIDTLMHHVGRRQKSTTDYCFMICEKVVQ